ncbi:MAG: transposase [Actinobacteria bacterium]|nr:transposase [Actinomycetota bacterium]
MTIPGIGVASAVTLIAAIGDITRFEDPRKLVGYLGLDPKVRQSGDAPARGGKISKRGNAQARSVLVEAAWAAMRTPGPLRAFGQRVQARSGGQIAAVAVARKIAVLAWHLLTRGEDYAFARPSLVRKKIRDAELAAGAPRLPKRHTGQRVSSTPAERGAEQQLADHAETAYKRISADRSASRPAKAGAGATPGRASQRPSRGKAARQAQAPRPAL